MPFYSHSEVKCVNEFEMHHITSWTFLYMQGDSSIQEKMAADCRLKRLVLWGDNTLPPILNGVKDNCSITHLHVCGEPIATCLQLHYTMYRVYVHVWVGLTYRQNRGPGLYFFPGSFDPASI